MFLTHQQVCYLQIFYQIVVALWFIFFPPVNCFKHYLPTVLWGRIKNSVALQAKWRWQWGKEEILRRISRVFGCAFLSCQENQAWREGVSQVCCPAEDSVGTHCSDVGFDLGSENLAHVTGTGPSMMEALGQISARKTGPKDNRYALS